MYIFYMINVLKIKNNNLKHLDEIIYIIII